MADEKLDSLPTGVDPIVGCRHVLPAPPRGPGPTPVGFRCGSATSPRSWPSRSEPAPVADWPLRSSSLRERTAVAVADPVLRGNVAGAVDRFTAHKADALAAVHDPDGLRRAARGVRSEVLSRWSEVLERLADNVMANGGHVHWAADGGEANELDRRHRPADRCPHGGEVQVDGHRGDRAQRGAGRRRLRGHRDRPGRVDHPAGRRAPQPHHHPRRAPQPAPDRRHLRGGSRVWPSAPPSPRSSSPSPEGELRRRFLEADLGITGVNLGVAEIGQRGAGDQRGQRPAWSRPLPKVHVAVMGAERIVDTWDQADLLLGLLARVRHRPATQHLHPDHRRPGRRRARPTGPTSSTSSSSTTAGPTWPAPSSPRCSTASAAGPASTSAPCTARPGATPTAGSTPGPMGAVLTPLLGADGPDDDAAGEVADASTLCGACMEACPVEIPLQDLLLSLAPPSGRPRTAGRTGPVAGLVDGMVTARRVPGVGHGRHEVPAVGPARASAPRRRPVGRWAIPPRPAGADVP